MNILTHILNANKKRDPERLAMKFKAMRENSFVFLRGTNHLFYERLPKNGLFKSAPVTWCCGDLHVQNFGSYKGDNRQVYFDINDFDEAALAPLTWELVRVAASILTFADTAGTAADDSRKLCKHFLKAYAFALAAGKARWVEKETAEGMVADLFDKLQHRSRAEFLDDRTEKKRKRRRFILDGKKSLPVSGEQREQVTHFIDDFAANQPHPEFFKVLDVARRISGTGSLGLDRYAILVEGKGSPDRNYLLDLKQSQKSSIAKHLPELQPVWQSQAQRIVAIQHRMQAVSMAFLEAEKFNSRSYVLQALQPSEDRIPLHKHADNTKAVKKVLETMAQCLAWAQLRSSGRQGSAIADELIEFAENHKKWRPKLFTIAKALTQQNHTDWQHYAQAYDDGFFNTTTQST